MTKKILNTRIDADVLDRVRAAVVALQRLHGPHVTLSDFASEALNVAVTQVETSLNNGQPFPTPDRPLQPGARLQETSDSTESPRLDLTYPSPAPDIDLNPRPPRVDLSWRDDPTGTL